jgi:hypothetical protein
MQRWRVTSTQEFSCEIVYSCSMRLALTFLACVLSLTAQSRFLKVGANEQYKTLASLPALAGGDLIEIYPGFYPGTKTFRASNTCDKPITVRGIGNPVIDGDGSSARGLLEFEGGCFVLEDLTAQNIFNGNLNSCGIRSTTAKSLTVRRVKIRNTDMGIFSSDPSGEIIVEHCDIGYNGRGPLGHNLYLHGQHAVLRQNHIHHSLGGQNVKIRNRTAELIGNYIHDGNDGEVEFVESPFTIDPGADAVMDGNLVVGKVNRGEGANRQRFINFGHSGIVGTDRAGTLYLRNNTLIARNVLNIFVTLASPNAALVSDNNAYFGSKELLRDRYGSKGVISKSDFWQAVGLPVAARFSPAPPILPAPVNLKAENGMAGKSKIVNLSWDAVPNASYYVIYSRRMNSAGVVGPLRLWGSADSNSFRDLGPMYAGKSNSYVVMAVNAEDVESPSSASVSIVIP